MFESEVNRVGAKLVPSWNNLPKGEDGRTVYVVPYAIHKSLLVSNKFIHVCFN